MLSQRMTPLLTSAPFLLAAKLSSQRFSGVLAWLKICSKRTTVGLVLSLIDPSYLFRGVTQSHRKSETFHPAPPQTSK